MAYVARTLQGRRQDEGEVGGQDYGQTGQPTGGVQGVAKQSNTAKTPMQAQVKQAQGRDQSAAVNRLYQPVQSGFERAAGALAGGANAYGQANAQQNQAYYGTDKAGVQEQLRAQSLSAPLQQTLAGQKPAVGALDLKVPMFQAASELMKGGATPGLMRTANGKYSGGTAALDSQLLRKSGAMGQLIPKVQEGTRNIQGMEKNLERDATLAAEQASGKAYEGQRSAIRDAIGDEKLQTMLGASGRFQAETGRLEGQRKGVRGAAESKIEAAAKRLSDSGFDPKILNDIDIGKYVQDVQGPTDSSQFLGADRGYASYLNGLEGQFGGVPAAALPGEFSGGNVGFDQLGFDKQLDGILAGARKPTPEQREKSVIESKTQEEAHRKATPLSQAERLAKEAAMSPQEKDALDRFRYPEKYPYDRQPFASPAAGGNEGEFREYMAKQDVEREAQERLKQMKMLGGSGTSKVGGRW